MDRWQSLIDQQLNKAKQDGELSNLPGEGKPLNLAESPYTPGDKRLAYKIMSDNNIAPDWIAMGLELDERRTKMLDTLQRAGILYLKVGDDRAWRRAQNDFRTAVLRYNKDVLNYNLKLPPGFTHKHQIDPDRAIAQAWQ